MMNRLLVFALVAVAVAGCQPKQVAKGPTDDPATSPQVGGTTTGGDSTEPGTEKEPTEALVNPKDPAGIQQPVLPNPEVKINTNDKTWTDESVDGVEIARKMDAALRGAKNALVETKTTFDIAGVGQLDGKAQIKVRDASTFMVEYYLPETEAHINRVVSNKSGRATLQKSNWKAGGPKPLANPVTDASAVTSFEDQFMERIFATYTTGQDAWEPIVEAWSKGQAGYDLEVEKKSMKVNGKDRPFYRFLAQRKSDGKATIEVRVDGIRYFPVSIRVLRTEKNGEESQIRWNAEWKFGGSFSDKDFPIPIYPSKA